MTDPHEQVRAAIVALIPRLRRFARTVANNDDQADEFVVSALERAAERHTLGGRIDECSLFSLVREAALDPSRPQQRQPSPSAQISEVFPIEAALHALPEEQRTAVALVLIEGLTYAQAAHVMDLSLGTFTTRLVRGREALQAVL